MFARLSLVATFCCTSMISFSAMYHDSLRILKHQPSEETALVFETKSNDAPVCHSLEQHQIDFTLVTQLSSSRLFIMEEQCRRWGPHPISLALVSNLSVVAIQLALEKLGCRREYVSVKVIHSEGNAEPFPVNKLRNLAFSGVKTSHAAYVDADFLVSVNLYDSLMQKRGMLDNPKSAFVLPAFELRKLCDPKDHDCRRIHRFLIPDTKEQVLELYSEPDGVAPSITQFDSKGNRAGHNSTRYQEWLSQSNDTLIPIHCFASDRYEPYLVVQYCQDMPPFQEAYTGYGQNKLTWLWHLRHSGYSFHQVGDGFVVHYPHAKSGSFNKWNHQKQKIGRENLRVEQISKKFREWLATNVSNQSVVGDCPPLNFTALA